LNGFKKGGKGISDLWNLERVYRVRVGYS